MRMMKKISPYNASCLRRSFFLILILSLNESKKCKQVFACGMKFLQYKKKISHYCHLPRHWIQYQKMTCTPPWTQRIKERRFLIYQSYSYHAFSKLSQKKSWKFPSTYFGMIIWKLNFSNFFKVNPKITSLANLCEFSFHLIYRSYFLGQYFM